MKNVLLTIFGGLFGLLYVSMLGVLLYGFLTMNMQLLSICGIAWLVGDVLMIVTVVIDRLVYSEHYNKPDIEFAEFSKKNASYVAQPVFAQNKERVE